MDVLSQFGNANLESEAAREAIAIKLVELIENESKDDYDEMSVLGNAWLNANSLR